MSLNNKLCTRCQFAYAQRKNDQNQWVCENCFKTIDFKMQSESIRPCPVDGKEMDKIVIQTVVIDRCPLCHGIWLDDNEVQALTTGLQGEFLTTKKDPSSNSGFFKGLLTGLIIK